MFTEEFGAYVIGDGSASISCEVDGFKCIAIVYHDDDASPPWKRDDGHGPVSEWTERDKEPGERVLSSDGRSHRFYDFAEAVKIARRDGWGSEGDAGLNPRQKAARAAEHDFTVLKAWCDNEWHYSGVAVRIWRADVPLTGKYDHALWGVERNYPGSDNGYLTECANQMLDEALDAARAKLAALCACDATS